MPRRQNRGSCPRSCCLATKHRKWKSRSLPADLCSFGASRPSEVAHCWNLGEVQSSTLWKVEEASREGSKSGEKSYDLLCKSQLLWFPTLRWCQSGNAEKILMSTTASALRQNKGGHLARSGCKTGIAKAISSSLVIVARSINSILNVSGSLWVLWSMPKFKASLPGPPWWTMTLTQAASSGPASMRTASGSCDQATIMLSSLTREE